MKSFFKIAALEIFKLARQRKFIMAMIGMNCVPIMAAGLLLLVVAYGALSKGTLNFSIILGYVPGWSRDLLNVHYAAFISTAGFFIAMFLGETVSREFSDGTIETELLTPVTRLQVYLGKLAGVFAMYAFSLLTGLAVLGTVTGIYYYGRPNWFDGVARVFAPEEVGLVLLCGVFMTAFTGALAAFASSIESCMGYAVSLTIFMGMSDTAIEVFKGTGDISLKYYDVLKHSSTRSVVAIIETLASSETGAGILAQLREPVYSLTIHSMVFLLIGFLLFRGREVRAE